MKNYTYRTMYVVDTLKEEFPFCMSELDAYDKYLRRYLSDKVLFKVFDSSKSNYSLLQKAFASIQNNDRTKFSMYMNEYSKTLKSDPDFLQECHTL